MISSSISSGESIKQYSFSLDDNNFNDKNYVRNDQKIVNVLVQDIDDAVSLLSTLRERLNFDNIKDIERGVLWTLFFDKSTEAEKTAKDITKNLLMNENYQKFKIIK